MLLIKKKSNNFKGNLNLLVNFKHILFLTRSPQLVSHAKLSVHKRKLFMLLVLSVAYLK